MALLATIVLSQCLLLEPFASARFEGRLGEAPLVAGAPPRASVVLSADGTLGVRLRPPRLDVTFAYRPRALWRQPNLLDEQRPLLMHGGALGATLAWTRRTQLYADGLASYGQPDYIGLRAVLGQDQRALPVVTRLLAISANVGLQSRLARRWEAELPLSVFHLDPLEQPPIETDPSGPPVTLLPRQTAITFRPQLTHALSARTRLSGQLGPAYQTLSIGVRVATLTPQLGVTHRLSETSVLVGAFGVTVAAIQQRLRAETPQRDVTPVGQMQLSGELWRDGRTRLTATGGAQVSWFLDPVAATTGPLGSASGAVQLHLDERTRLDASARFTTSVARAPRPGGFNETLASAQLGWLHRMSRAVTLMAGALWIDQAPHLATPRFRFNQRELWGYAAIELHPPLPGARVQGAMR